MEFQSTLLSTLQQGTNLLPAVISLESVTNNDVDGLETMLQHLDEAPGALSRDRLRDAFEELRAMLLLDQQNAAKAILLSAATHMEEAGLAWPSVAKAIQGSGLFDPSSIARVRAALINEVGEPKEIPPDKMVKLKRGGVLIKLDSGNIQIGSPPETVKDTMKEGGAALVILDSDTLMDWRTVRNLGEPEFPMYFGFFVLSGLKAPAQFLTAPDAAPHIDMILRTSYAGPQWDFTNDELADEYPQGRQTPGFPNMTGELAHFAGFKIDQMRKIHVFNEAGAFVQGNFRVIYLGESRYRIFEKGRYVGDIDIKQIPHPPRALPDMEKFHDPQFQAVRYRALFEGEPMLIPISSSHGFDGVEGTSGHMAWNAGRVVLIDPPADILDFLVANHIPLSAIDGVIVTHVHADHDQGALQVLMAADQAKLYTTAVIEKMFIDKLFALSLGRFPKEKLRKLWNSKHLPLLQPVTLNGQTFFFYHGFHSNIPIGFNILDDEGRPVFGYSGDTLNDPPTIYALKSIISRERAAHITEFPLAALYAGGTSVHEQGVPPIHTPAERLAAAQNVARTMRSGGQLLAYHVTGKDAEKYGLQKWGVGFHHAISLAQKLAWRKRSETENVVRAMQHLAVFKGMGPAILRAMVLNGQVRIIGPNTKIIEEGKAADKMFLLIDGAVAVTQSDTLLSQREEGLLGEASILGEATNATVRTTKPSLLFEFNFSGQENFLKRTGLLKRLAHLREMRQLAYEALAQSPLLAELDGDTIDHLLQIAERVETKAGERLIRKGSSDRDLYFVVDGSVTVDLGEHADAVVLERGNFIGEMALVNRKPRNATAKTKTAAMLLKFPAEKLEDLFRQRPTLKLRLMSLTAERGRVEREAA